MKQTIAVLLGLVIGRLIHRLSQLVCSQYPRTTSWSREEDATAVVFYIAIIVWLAFLLWGNP